MAKKLTLNETCQAKDCQNPATVEFGPTRLCAECYTKCAYDMQPLILKSHSRQPQEKTAE